MLKIQTTYKIPKWTNLYFFSICENVLIIISDYILQKVEFIFYEVEHEFHFFIESNMFRIRDLRK